MEPDRTTTMGEGEFDTTLSDFHNIKAVLRTRAKLRTCCKDCRGLARADVNSENMVIDLDV